MALDFSKKFILQQRTVWNCNSDRIVFTGFFLQPSASAGEISQGRSTERCVFLTVIIDTCDKSMDTFISNFCRRFIEYQI